MAFCEAEGEPASSLAGGLRPDRRSFLTGSQKKAMAWLSRPCDFLQLSVLSYCAEEFAWVTFIGVAWVLLCFLCFGCPAGPYMFKGFLQKAFEREPVCFFYMFLRFYVQIQEHGRSQRLRKPTKRSPAGVAGLHVVQIS